MRGAAGSSSVWAWSPPSRGRVVPKLFAPRGLDVSSEVIVSRAVSAASSCFEDSGKPVDSFCGPGR